MSPTGKTQTIAVVAILVVVMGGGVVAGYMLLNPPPSSTTGSVTLTLLYNAGVMIEANGMRIYVDPISLPSNYSSLPADAVLITHPHGDHYNSACIDMLQKENTVNIMPKNMTTEVSAHNAVGVNPLDSVQVGEITITAYYMYTEIWIDGECFASHPSEANWTSYIIDIGGFKIFHAGDSKNITEYEQISGQIDVALLPLGPGCQSMSGMEIVDAVAKLQPDYFIPIHFEYSLSAEIFVLNYTNEIQACSDCTPMWLHYWHSYTFEY
ncbi:MAG: MBL fold metallo-hydrolase [Candidatus Thorarchaeota archaeon]|nr:MBL fold metallo-hydrolase [Candidatus Thorarchaeota archaeon]